MKFNWSAKHIQNHIVYFKFSFNDKDWLLTSLNNQFSLIDITRPWHKTYKLTLNRSNSTFTKTIYLDNKQKINANVSLQNKTITMELAHT
jgi:hypothetical protein